MTKKLSKKAYKENSKRNEARKLQSELLLPKIPKISLELVYWLHKYKTNKECGIKLENKFFNHVPFDVSDKKELLSKYFIQSALESTNKNEAKVYLKSIYPNHYENLQIIVESQLINFNHFIGLHKMEIESKYFQFTNPKFDGTIDLVLLDNRKKTIVPEKKRILVKLIYTDKIDTDWSNDILESDYNRLVEPLHYKMLANWEWGIDDIPFYYFVFSNKDKHQYKVFCVNSFSDTIKQHYSTMINVKEYLDEQIILGFKAKATIKNCVNCTIKDTCKHYTDTPKIETINI